MPNVTAYLSDDLAAQVKEHELSLSALLQGAARAEIERLDQLAAAADGMTRQTVDLNDRNGTPVRLRFTGEFITGDGNPAVYRTDAGKVLIVWEEDYDTFDDVERFSDWVANYEERNNLGRQAEAIVSDAVAALGGRIVIDL